MIRKLTIETFAITNETTLELSGVTRISLNNMGTTICRTLGRDLLPPTSDLLTGGSIAEFDAGYGIYETEIPIRFTPIKESENNTNLLIVTLNRIIDPIETNQTNQDHD